jgi:hypothetical protein
MGMLLQRHYQAHEASAAAKRDALLAEVDAARAKQAELALERAQAAQAADDVPCAACVELKGVRPCSVECYVKAGYKAENFEAFVANAEASVVAAEAEEARLKAEADAAAKAEAERLAAKQAEADRLAAEAQAAAAAQAEAEAAAKKAAEEAELKALEEATRPDPAPEAKPEEAPAKSGKSSRK